MDDEKEIAATDPTDRMSAALNEWNSDNGPGVDAGKGDAADPDKAAAPAAAAAAGDDKAKGDAAAKADADKAAADAAAAAAGDDAKLPFFNEPRFQEIYKESAERKTQLDAFNEIFTKGAYSIDSTDTLKAVLADSYMLYDIAGGKKHPGELMDLLKANWTPEQYKATLQGLADYCMKNGVKPDEKAATAEPWRKELDDLKAKDTARERAADDEKRTTAQMKTVEKVESKISELCVKAGFDVKEDAAEIADYILAIGSELGQDGKNKKIVEQLEKGQFGELERVFTTYHNKILARAKRLGDRTLKTKQDKDKIIPRTPAGGAPPAAGAKANGKRDLRTSEGRVNAALQEFNK